jgi:HPt (histidine-containing phosphotransfer) domain-containing protein
VLKAAEPILNGIATQKGNKVTHVDWQRVDDLASEIGSDAVVEVVAMFLEETDVVIARLAMAPPTADDFHFLKGSALNLGLTDFATLCQKGESQAKHGANAEDMRAETLVRYDAAKTALLAGIATRFGG